MSGIIVDSIGVGFDVLVVFDVEFGVVVVEFGAVGCGAVMMEQAREPSGYVYSNLVSPGSPHFPSQEPPLPQHVTLPVLVRPHFGHTKGTKDVLYVINIVSDCTVDRGVWREVSYLTQGLHKLVNRTINQPEPQLRMDDQS